MSSPTHDRPAPELYAGRAQDPGGPLMNLFWRRTVKELAARLDDVDELIHRLVVTLEEMEGGEQAPPLPPPHPCCPRDASERL